MCANINMKNIQEKNMYAEIFPDIFLFKFENP